MSQPKLNEVRDFALAEMAKYLDLNEWSFGFDYAKRRFGLCNYTEKKISLSKYLVLHHSDDEIKQVLLHEIAHAMSGKRAGHSKRWLATAISIGYRNEKLDGAQIANETAKFRGVCPNGHEHFRFRKPTRLLSCAKCSSTFSRRFLISWSER